MRLSFSFSHVSKPLASGPQKPQTFRGEKTQPQAVLVKSNRRDFSPDSWFQFMNIRHIVDTSIYNAEELALCSKTDERDIRVFVPAVLNRMKEPALTAFFRQHLMDMAPLDQKDITDALTASKPWKIQIYLEKSETGQPSLRMHFALDQLIQNLRIPFELNEKNEIQPPAEDLNQPGCNRAQFYPDEKRANGSTAYVEAYLLPNLLTGSKAGDVAQIGVCDIKRALAESGRMAYELSGLLFDFLERQKKATKPEATKSEATKSEKE